MDKMLQMLILQQQLNDATNGQGWEKGVTKNGKPINWKRCIYMECAEMVDSFAWKHWKDIAQEPDWANLQIEVVDVWHFVMSEALRDRVVNLRGTIDELALNMEQMPSWRALGDAHPYASPDAIMDKVEELMFDALRREEFHLDPIVHNFFDLVKMAGLSSATLYRLYVGKNILNQFRQDHGYKEGTYRKLWKGEEDNAVMKRIWDECGELTPEALYKELEKHYLAG